MSKSLQNLSFSEENSKKKLIKSFLSETRLSFSNDNIMCGSNSIKNQGEISEYQESNYKYITTITYFFTALVCCIGQSTFVPITPIIMDQYDLSRQQVTMSMLVIFMVMPFSTFPANYVLDNMGLKFGMTLGVILLSAGSFIRTFIDYNWYYVLIGQAIIGIGIPFIQNCPSKVSAAWFNQINRQSITLLFTFAILMSAPLGFIMPSVYINQFSDQHDIKKLILHQFYIIGTVTIINILFFREKPKIAPSISMTIEKEKFCKSLKLLIKNKSYVFVFLSSSIFLGAINGFIPNLALWLAPFGFNENDCSLFTISILIFGIVGSIISSYYLKKNQQYKKITIICLIMGITLFGTAYFTLYVQSTIITCIVIALSGFFLFPVISIQIEMATELSFPVGEAMATGLLFSGGQLFGFIIGVISTSIIDGETKTSSFEGIVCVVVLILISSIFMALSKNDLVRSKIDSQQGQDVQNLLKNDKLNLKQKLLNGNDNKEYQQVIQKYMKQEQNIIDINYQSQSEFFVKQEEDNIIQQFDIQGKFSEISLFSDDFQDKSNQNSTSDKQ